MNLWDPHKAQFLFGTATSAHQTEGNNVLNDWRLWEREGRVPPAADACQHYHRYVEDIALIAELGHNAYRFSIEWSRVEPREGFFSEDALNHYRRVIEELLNRKIQPVITLHHFTNPQWFAEKGGWVHEESVFYFKRYVSKVIETIGRDVCFWITINEPMVYLYRSYIEGIWPPGEKSIGTMAHALRHLIKAHIESYREIHRIYDQKHQQPVWVSIAKNVIEFTPHDDSSWTDRMAVFMRDWFFNRLFLDALSKGFLFFPGMFCESLGSSQTLDFIGVNYYYRQFVRFSGFNNAGIFGQDCPLDDHPLDIRESTQMGWEVFPEGLYTRLMALKHYRRPVMVCENGIATLKDPQRERYIENHLIYLHRAMQDGLIVWGYLYWSLFDNYEWERGYVPRFGLIEIDPPTKERKVRRSAQVFTELCRKYFL